MEASIFNGSASAQFLMTSKKFYRLDNVAITGEIYLIKDISKFCSDGARNNFRSFSYYFSRDVSDRTIFTR